MGGVDCTILMGPSGRSTSPKGLVEQGSIQINATNLAKLAPPHQKSHYRKSEIALPTSEITLLGSVSLAKAPKTLQNKGKLQSKSAPLPSKIALLESEIALLGSVILDVTIQNHTTG